MTQKSTDPVIQKVTAWLTPTLIGIIGWFCINKLDNIQSSIDQINPVKTELALTKKDVSNLDMRTSKIEQTLYSYIQTERLVGKHEEIYRIPKKNTN